NLSALTTSLRSSRRRRAGYVCYKSGKKFILDHAGARQGCPLSARCSICPTFYLGVDGYIGAIAVDRLHFDGNSVASPRPTSCGQGRNIGIATQFRLGDDSTFDESVGLADDYSFARP